MPSSRFFVLWDTTADITFICVASRRYMPRLVLVSTSLTFSIKIRLEDESLWLVIPLLVSLYVFSAIFPLSKCTSVLVVCDSVSFPVLNLTKKLNT